LLLLKEATDSLERTFPSPHPVDQVIDVAVIPIVGLVANVSEHAEILRGIEHLDDRQVTAKEVA